jgi:DNA modification methylase
VELYVQHTVEIMREMRRILRKDGVMFWNVGDSYAGSYGNQGRKKERGTQRPINGSIMQPVDDDRYPSDGVATGKIRDAFLKPKDLCLIPERVAIAAQADGWWVRSMIVWSKPNPMPASVTDRPTNAYEHIIMLTKAERYFWDADAVAEPAVTTGDNRAARNDLTQIHGRGGTESRKSTGKPTGTTRNCRNVWTIATQGYAEAHFATFPEELPRRCIMAATSSRGACVQCGAPWERVTRIERSGTPMPHDGNTKNAALYLDKQNQLGPNVDRNVVVVGWKPTCECHGQHGKTRPCVVLDPFAGSGTTGRVAVELSRDVILNDLHYQNLAHERVKTQKSLLF